MLYCICRIKLSTLVRVVYCLLVLVIFYFILEAHNTQNYQQILLWWTPFLSNYERIIKCNPGGYKCLVTSKREYVNDGRLSGFLFYGSKISNFDFPLPRNENLLWAVFHEESPKNFGPFLYGEIQTLFNITSTFSQLSDFPMTLQYLKNISTLTDKTYFIPVKAKNENLNKFSPVLYVQSDCDTPIGRDYLVKELSKHINIDSYGACLKNKNFPQGVADVYMLDLYHEEYMRFVSNYKFVISFENAICEDYITEKFWRPLIVGSIPVYLGASNIEQWMPNENSAILVKNFKDLETLGEFIKKVNQNDTLYNSFLEHKISEKIENVRLKDLSLWEHPISEFECYVCKSMHENQVHSHLDDVNIYKCPKPTPRKNEINTWDQHWDIGRCQSKAMGILLGNNKAYTNETFEKTWKNLYYNKKC